MSEQFYTILTNEGRAKIASSLSIGKKLNLVTMKLGDGNGKYYNPNASQQELVNEVYQCSITGVELDKNNPQWITLTAVIPSEIGDFNIREVGVFDDTDKLIAIGKYPETYKPIATNGSTKELYIKMTLEVTNAQLIESIIDPTVLIATKEDISNINNKIEQVNNQFSQLSNPNLLINGDFSVWQRGTSFTAVGTAAPFSADRWRSFGLASETTTITKLDNGINLKPSGAYNARCRQTLENELTKRLWGKTLTFSIKMLSNCSAIFFNINKSKNVVGYSKNFYNVLAGDILTITFEVTNDFENLSVQFSSSDTNGYSVEWAKLEVGTIATPFTHSPYAEELALCQRYYEKSYLMEMPPATDSSFGRYMISKNPIDNAFYGTIPFKVTKRTIPTIITYKPDGSLLGKSGITATDKVIDVNASADKSLLDFQWIADAEIY